MAWTACFLRGAHASVRPAGRCMSLCPTPAWTVASTSPCTPSPCQLCQPCQRGWGDGKRAAHAVRCCSAHLARTVHLHFWQRASCGPLLFSTAAGKEDWVTDKGDSVSVQGSKLGITCSCRCVAALCAGSSKACTSTVGPPAQQSVRTEQTRVVSLTLSSCAHRWNPLLSAGGNTAAR